MKLTDIKNELDIVAYVDGSLNDLEADISTKEEVSLNLINLIVWVVEKDRKNQIDKLEKIINGDVNNSAYML